MAAGENSGAAVVLAQAAGAASAAAKNPARRKARFLEGFFGGGLALK